MALAASSLDRALPCQPSLSAMNEMPCALYGLGDDGERLLAEAHGAEHFEDFLHVMAVDDFGAPVEGRETPAVNIHVMAESRRLALAQAVHVHDGDEIVELVNAGERGGFPDGTLGAFRHRPCST